LLRAFFVSTIKKRNPDSFHRQVNKDDLIAIVKNSAPPLKMISIPVSANTAPTFYFS